MQKGRVIKAQNSFFYVQADHGPVTCKLRGKFKKGEPVYPGDWVEYESLPDGTGVLDRIQERRNLLKRPAVANIDQVVVVFAAAQPDPHPLLLNKFLVLAEFSRIPSIVILVNKMDLCPQGSENAFQLYQELGYPVLRASAKDVDGVDCLCKILAEKTTVFTGPSGVGKSSLLNRVEPSLNLGTGKVSEKIKRGRHTTRIARLLPYRGGYVVDTPGFSSVDLLDLDERDLSRCFREFLPYEGACRFSACTHSHEPQCAVKMAVEAGEIFEERYEAYRSMLGELRNRKKEYP